MAFDDSKYQDDYEGAKEALNEFGVSGIKMFRLPEETQGQTPDPSQDPPEPEEQSYDFTVVILPISRNEPGQEENLEETFGKQRAIICRETTEESTETDYEFVKARDFFTVNGKEYQVVSVQTINPDQQFSVLFDCIVSG